jgi:hypothetical protein
MADDISDALRTPDGAALATELVEMLECELVRFCHRVAHDHGIELDRARAAMVLLGKLVAAGVPWTARPDCEPTRIHDAFSRLLPRHPAAIATPLKRELASFFIATTDVRVIDDEPATTPTALLRRAGAEPQLWWWASDHDTPARCWAACGDDAGRLVQLALAFGASSDPVARALAGALGVLATRLKTRHTQQRTALVPVLLRLASQGGAAVADPAVLAAVTKTAFELTAAQQLLARDLRAPDPFADLAVHAFQLVELLGAAAAAGNDRGPDLERHAQLARRIAKTFAARGLVLAAMLRKELDPVVTAALASPR